MKEQSGSESDTPAVQKKTKVVKAPQNEESTTETEDDEKVYRFDANGNLYAEKKHKSKGNTGFGKGVSVKKSDGTKGTTDAGRGTPSQSKTSNKPTKRFFVNNNKKSKKTPEISDEESSSSSGSSDSSGDSSSSSDDDDASEVEGNDDDDDYVPSQENEEEDLEEVQEKPPPNPKKGYKTKGANQPQKKILTKKNTSGGKGKNKKTKEQAEGLSEQEQKKKRKSRWTDSENRRLVDQVRPKYELLTGKFKKLDGKNAKEEAWKIVTAEVNRCTDIGRAMKDVKKKFGYLKAAAKKKVKFTS